MRICIALGACKAGEILGGQAKDVGSHCPPTPSTLPPKALNKMVWSNDNNNNGKRC